ncbi:glutaminase [Nitratireductor rhodophyticola]|uniref:glutaminase n=1 Tax=Nitratireductor rhodophyticola TaxID=2854036 RepID=UPI003BA97261
MLDCSEDFSIPDLMERICDRRKAETEKGTVADYIPELASTDPSKFGISVCLADGRQFSAGDATTAFSIQSVSKVFTLAIALGRYGDGFWQRVGREPSSNAFNSLRELEARNGIPSNPFVNAGAIVTTDMVMAQSMPAETLAEILHFVSVAASDTGIRIDPSVANSEELSGHKNWALAHVLAAYGNLRHACELTLGTYFHHCAIEMTCEQLARSGRFLANFPDERPLVPSDRVKSINALMMTCGHYNGSGEFAYRVGLPGKSGVGGAILAIVPRIASIATWGPGLDRYGNSLLGTTALVELSEALGWSVFLGGSRTLGVHDIQSRRCEARPFAVSKNAKVGSIGQMT